MSSSHATPDSAWAARALAQSDPWLADTLPPDMVGELTFSKVDIDLDGGQNATVELGQPRDQRLDLNLDLDLDALAGTDPMFDASRAGADAHAPALPTGTPTDPLTDTPADHAVNAGATVATPAPAPQPAVWPDTVRHLPPSWTDKRVLIVTSDDSERMYLRARLALAQLVWVDDAATTTQALAALTARPYAMAFVNMDSVAIDGLSIATQLRAGNVAAALILTSNTVSGRHPLNVLARWRRWRLGRHLGHDHGAEVLAKPLVPREVVSLLSRLTTPLVI